MLTLSFEIPETRYYAIKTQVNDLPVLIQKDDCWYSAKYNGDVWRLCTDDYCMNAWWPSKEAAQSVADEVKDFTWTLQ